MIELDCVRTRLYNIIYVIYIKWVAQVTRLYTRTTRPLARACYIYLNPQK